MTDRLRRSISLSRQKSETYSKPQFDRSTSWINKGPALGRCLSIQESEPHRRDLVVVVQEKSYHLHSDLLKKASPVFPSLLQESSDASDEGETQVHIKDITPTGFDAIVSWIYYEKVQIKAGHLKQIYEAAQKLQVEDVEKICEEYIEKTLNPHNQADILLTCIELGLDDLFKYVLHTRPQVVLSQPVLDSLNLSQFIEVLGSDHLNIDERFLMKAAKQWMTNRKCSEDDVLKILKVIRLCLLHKDDLQMILQDIEPFPACQDVVKDAIAYLDETYTRSLKSGKFCQPRGIPKCFFFGGLVESESDTVSRVPFKLRKSSLAFELDLSSMESGVSDVTELASLPDKVVDPVTLSKNNVVFAIGGYVRLRMNNKEVNLQPIPGNLCLRYEARINRWDEMAPLSYSRWCHGAVWCNDYILVIGGVTTGCLTYGIGTVELYDIASNTWSLRSPFPYGIRNLAACDVGNHAYISGGSIDYKGSLTPVDHLYHYDTTEDRWNLAGHMCRIREHHSMIGKDGKIFIFGGSSDVSAEVFDIITHQSTYIDAIPGNFIYSPLKADDTEEDDVSEKKNVSKTVRIPELINFNIAASDDLLILAGGVQQMNVLVYNTTTKQWSGLPVPINARRHNTSFALLHIPSGGGNMHQGRRKTSSCSVS